MSGEIMTDFALGEVQALDTPATRHAVADAQPGDWGRATCPAAPRVWVHEVAGAPVPFPGPLGGNMACPECASIVASTRPSPADTFTQEKSRWSSLIWRRRWPD